MPQRMLRDTWEAGVRRTEATGSAYVLTTSAFALGSPVPRSCTLQSECVPDISWEAHSDDQRRLRRRPQAPRSTVGCARCRRHRQRGYAQRARTARDRGYAGEQSRTRARQVEPPALTLHSAKDVAGDEDQVTRQQNHETATFNRNLSFYASNQVA